jgi:uncharacterized membrane protein
MFFGSTVSLFVAGVVAINIDLLMYYLNYAAFVYVSRYGRQVDFQDSIVDIFHIYRNKRRLNQNVVTRIGLERR